MYRKAMSEMAQDTSPTHTLVELKTISTVSSIPVVEMAWTKAVLAYEMIKNANGLTKWTLGATESSVGAVARFTLPIVEKPLKAVDGLTSKGLDTLVTRVPAINTKPEQIFDNTKIYVNSKLQPAITTAQAAKQYGTEKAIAVGSFGLNTTNTMLNNRVGHALLGTVNMVATVANDAVDTYLPAEEEEEESATKYLSEDNNELAKSLNNVTNVVAVTNRRFVKASIRRLNRLNKMSKESVDAFTSTLESIRNTKPSEVYGKVASTWQDLGKEPAENETDIAIARRLARQVVNVCNSAYSVSGYLTSSLLTQLNTASLQAVANYNRLMEVAHLKDLSDKTVDQMKTNAALIQSTLTSVASIVTGLFAKPQISITEAEETTPPPSENPDIPEHRSID